METDYDYLKLLAYASILAFIITWAWGMSLIFRNSEEGSDSENKKDPNKEEDKK
ncbi:MAG: hypothetical protein ACREX9_07090 [Gammaproteobacteria bacterium]